MKRLFKGNIKHEYISYIWVSIILVAFIGISVGTLLIYSALKHDPGSVDRISLLVFSVLAYLFGILYSSLIIFSIRKYPKYPKLRRMCLNSDCYFVGSDSKEFRVHHRGRLTFDMVTTVAKQNEGLENIKYPTKYKVYIVLSVIGIALMFVNIIGAYLLMENIILLPENLQSESTIFAVFVVFEILDIVVTFLFAFRVKNIHKDVIEEYRRKK